MQAISGNVQTERGLVYVEAHYDSEELARMDGYGYAFTSERLGGVKLFSKCLDERGLHHTFATVGKMIGV